jgi:hypothetical protein
MIDMTNNRVPYGLMTDEEKAALHEHYKHAGAFKVSLGEDAWAGVLNPSWSNEGIYRTVPLPAKTQDIIAWERLPAWVEWVARYVHGAVLAYDEEPECRGDWWVEGTSSTRPHRRIDDFPGIVQIGTVDWQDSKQRRPRG